MKDLSLSAIAQYAYMALFLRKETYLDLIHGQPIGNFISATYCFKYNGYGWTMAEQWLNFGWTDSAIIQP